jgi:SpoIID/LytB domain protein
MSWSRVMAAGLVIAAACAAGAGVAVIAAPSSGAAYFVRDLQNPRDRREARADILDTPLHPGSTVKAVALVAALESGVITPDSSYVCRRQVTLDGRTFVCAHPDLKRPLSPSEALAYSCNDFFVSLAAPADVLLSPTIAQTRTAPATSRAVGPSIRLGRTLADGSTRVETIALDDYIAQVLAGEGQPSAADAAQQALAITARTFALANRNRHRREGFDLCDTTHCQVLRPSTVTSRRAADATSNRVLLYEGQPAFVFYSAWCGGRSELASQVWPGAVDYPYEPPLEDDACKDGDPWTSEIRAGDIERALKEAGLRGNRLLDLRVLARNASKRVARIRLDGFTPSEMSGHEFRMAVGRVVGWQLLKSTAFDVERTGTGYRFRGRGFGHGVGLCVLGAGNRALRGATAEEILRVYYPGLQIGPIPPTQVTTTASASPTRRPAPSAPAPSAPAPSAPPPLAPVAPPAPLAPSDVALALPASEESERTAVTTLVRKSRDDIATLTGVTPPARLRVTVHPTVDSFGRATGQPWWVSGATEGSSIETLPIAVLRRQGQLDRTIRHEVAHALLDASLANRPMWVREGAAAYFSDATPRKGKPPRIPCPTDAELLRAISAGAQREAYARAEICFARAIADGKKWSEVR